jgi:transcriptional regulator with XRE-family HTH domain
MDTSLTSPVDVLESIGRRAKQRRIAMGLRQTDLARKAGVPISTLRRFEAGEASLKTAVLVAFALSAEREFQALFPEHDTRTLNDILAAKTPRRRVRR